MSSDEENMFEMSKKMIDIKKLLSKKKVSFDEDLEEVLTNNNFLSKELEYIACKIRDSDKYLTEEIETLEKESDRDDIYSELQDILAPYYDELIDLTDTTDNLRKRFETFKENVSLLFENLLDIEKRIINLQE
jgi:hypothetical protein